jgi:DNA-binding NarL/FixJ family response regulator
VLRLLVTGQTDREIADILFISHATARSHVSSILRKLDVTSRTAAASYAFQHGLI